MAVKTSPSGRQARPEQMFLEGGSPDKGTTAVEVLPPEPPPPANFVTMEKNLASLGFFTPSNKRIKNSTKKTVTTTREMGGKRVEARATILPSAEYGLPITADQDTYLAILKLALDMQRRTGQVTNPISFSTAEILRVQGKSAVSGYHYKELQEQLMRIKTATILSEGAVYFAGRRVWAKDAFNVVNRIVLFGTEMDDGTVADRHYIWLSEWQLENINSNYLLPIDYEAYKRLKGHIAKALVPLLQIWLYASRDEGVFEKRYDELCQILNVRQYQHPSKIREKIGPSLDELTAFGYLSRWQVELTSDRRSYKVLFFHGDKFYRDRRLRLASKPDGKGEARVEAAEPRPALPAPEPPTDEGLLRELRQRGVTPGRARKILGSLAPDQPVREQLAWGDFLIAQGGMARFYNPPGFYVYLLRENVAPPPPFLTPAKVAGVEAAEPVLDQGECQQAYEAYREQETAARWREFVADDEWVRAVDDRKKLLQKQYRTSRLWAAETLQNVAEAAVKAELSQRVPLLSWEEFGRRRRQGALG